MSAEIDSFTNLHSNLPTSACTEDVDNWRTYREWLNGSRFFPTDAFWDVRSHIGWRAKNLPRCQILLHMQGVDDMTCLDREPFFPGTPQYFTSAFINL